ncbi:MAG: glycosyltransferase family 2 protein [Clostridia bacterium]|nr:glycosyltransferase family 2 protein [Clostridia bacterium]
MINLDTISIIVPIHNTQKYLRRCVDSIINQSYKNLEILLIDDGSTDSSGIMCDDYKKIDSRVRVVHKLAGGAGSARNLALDICTGEFVCFVDSDDYIEINYCEKLISAIKINNADIAISGYYLDYPKKSIKSDIVLETKLINGPEGLLREYLSTAHVSGLLWNKIYSSSLWRSIRFPETRASEDNATSYKVFDRCNTAVIIPEFLYHYVQRDDSVEHKIIFKDHIVSIDFAEERYKYISNKYPNLENLANRNRWTIRIAMYYRLFITHSFLEYKDTLQKWISFFENNDAPSASQQEIQKKIVKHPYRYGYSYYLNFTIRKIIKKIIRR